MKLSTLGEGILLDRYALKDTPRKTLGPGSVILHRVDGQKQVTVVSTMFDGKLETVDGYALRYDEVDVPTETSIEAVFHRVAEVISKSEVNHRVWADKFFDQMASLKFIPAGRVMAGAGVPGLTLVNCFVIGSPHDSRNGIMEALGKWIETMSRGGGVGINLSTLRPRNAYVAGVNGRSSGAVSWAELFSFSVALIEQGGSRRGAAMIVLDDWHPDILEFINVKRDNTKILNANISVNVSDAFMRAVENDEDWHLRFPVTSDTRYDDLWNGDIEEWDRFGGTSHIYKTIKAREMWTAIIESAWASAEPGVLFVDRINAEANSHYLYRMNATNPCAEQPLPVGGACNLGTVNLVAFVKDATIDLAALRDTVRTAVRFLDNVVTSTEYPLQEQRDRQLTERRIGLSTMGLAEAMIHLGIRYGSEESLKFIDELYTVIRDEAYNASIDLALEKGRFPDFEQEYLDSEYAKRLPEDIRARIARYGIRNITILTQAPTGTTATMLGVSTGIEPFFMFEYVRKSRLGEHLEVVPIAREWQEKNPQKPLPEHYVTAMELSPLDHVLVQARIQRYIDSSISKTANVPGWYSVKETDELYRAAYKEGCKSVTIYRDGSRMEQILNSVPTKEAETDKVCPECGTALSVHDGCEECANCGYAACSY